MSFSHFSQNTTRETPFLEGDPFGIDSRGGWVIQIGLLTHRFF